MIWMNLTLFQTIGKSTSPSSWMCSPAQSATVAGYVDTPVLVLRVDGDKTVDSAAPSQQSKHFHHLAVVARHSQDVSFTTCVKLNIIL